MKQSLKKTVLLLALIGFLFMGCQNEPLENNKNQTIHGKINNVNIDEVPFLIPSVEKFNPQYKFLSSKALRINNKNEDLNLDLENIVEFVEDNGQKTYSIEIKEAIKEADYFENLHLVKVGDKYESFIIKYNPEDDSKSLDFLNYTGDLEFLDNTKELQGGISFQNGIQRLADPAPPRPRDDDEGGGGGSEPTHSWVWYFFHSIFYGHGDSGNVYFGSPWDSGSSTGGNNNGGGAVIIIDTGVIQSGTLNNNSGIPQSGNGTVYVVPNAPSEVQIAQSTYNTFKKTLTIEQQNFVKSKAEINNQLFLYFFENGFTQVNKEFAIEALNFVIDETNNSEDGASIEAQTALKITLDLISSNNFSNLNSAASNAIIEKHLGPIFPGLGLSDYLPKFSAITLMNMSVIMDSFPDNYKFTTKEMWKIFLESSFDTLHLGLDVLGTAPAGIGSIFDVVHGVWYTFSGDIVNGTISLSAAVPFAGDWTTVARMTKRIYALTNGSGRVILKAYKLASGVIVFSNRAQLRKILGITSKLIHAHHIIPYGLVKHELVQLAAKFSSSTKKAFHINDIANGIPIPADFHLTGHAIYSAKIDKRMTELFKKANGNMELAYDLLTDYMADIKAIIAANPNLTLGEIANLIP
jgi:hypothetical protein